MSGRSTLVCLHGFGGSGRDFDLLRARLPMALDTPDLGPPDFRPAPLAPGAALLGYSMGGRIALRAALEADAAPSALILVGASPGIKNPKERTLRTHLDRRLAAHILEVGAARFSDEWADVPLIRTQRRMPEPWLGEMRERRRAADPAALAAALERVGQGTFDPLWDRLHEVRCPVLLVTGESDAHYRLLAETMRMSLSEARHHVIEGAGHAAHLEQPDRFVAAILEFLGA